MEAAAKKSEIANSAEELIQDEEKDFSEGESMCLIDVSYYYSCINQPSFIYILLLFQFFNEQGDRNQNGGMYKQNIQEIQKTAQFLRAKAALIDIEVERRHVVADEITASVLMTQMKKRGGGSSSSSSKDDDAAKRVAINTDSQIY